jgi:hypothetical protein
MEAAKESIAFVKDSGNPSQPRIVFSRRMISTGFLWDVMVRCGQVPGVAEYWKSLQGSILFFPEIFMDGM